MRQLLHPKSRIGLICADSPINLVDPSGLDPNPFINPSVVAPMTFPSLTVNSGSGNCMDDPPINPQYSQDQIAQLAVAHFEAEGYPAWLAYAMVKAGVFAMNNETALATTNDILMAIQMLDGAGEVEAAAEGVAPAVDTFWAGQEAGMYAKASGGTVLNLSEDASSEEIMSASLNAARNASGNVNVFQSASGVSLDSTFVPEGQILINNPNVTSITYHIIMEDGSVTQIIVPK